MLIHHRHHLTNHGGAAPGTAPEFQRAIMQSPAFFPLANEAQQNATWERYLSLANCSNLAELRLQSEGRIRGASAEMLFNAPVCPLCPFLYFSIFTSTCEERS